MSQKAFSGTINVEILPEAMEELYLESTTFCGETRLRRLPQDMMFLEDSHKEELEGEVHPKTTLGETFMCEIRKLKSCCFFECHEGKCSSNSGLKYFILGYQIDMCEEDIK